jgi:dTDP-glucose 4,6-dehydratase
MKKVLVTGGAGFIGSNFVHFLLGADADVEIIDLDALTYAGRLENLEDLPDPKRHTFVKGDITDRALVDELFHSHQIDHVVHFAAESHVDRSILGTDRFIQSNIIGTFTLLDAARKAWLIDKVVPVDMVHFHHVSTDEVFGSLAPDEPAFSEQTPYAPRSPYAASKASSDHLVRAYAATYGLPVSITNCSNNYGPYQFPEKLIPLFILNAIQGKPLPVYGDGKQIRDWLYVEDHCEAIYTVIQKGAPGETYNVGGNNQPTNLEVIRLICKALDEMLPDSPYRPHENLIRYVKDRPGHDRRYDMNINKISRELGWEPRHNLETGMRRTVAWYLDHPGWIAAISGQADFQGWIDRNYTARGERK